MAEGVQTNPGGWDGALSDFLGWLGETRDVVVDTAREWYLAIDGWGDWDGTPGGDDYSFSLGPETQIPAQQPSWGGGGSGSGQRDYTPWLLAGAAALLLVAMIGGRK